MRVLLVTCGLEYGGAERIVEALAVDLSVRGDDVWVVATTRDGPIGRRLRGAGIPVHVLGLSLALDVRVPFELALYARRVGAEIAHSHLAVADIALGVARTVLPRARTITTVHNPGIELSSLKRGLWHLALRRMDKIVAVSEHAKRALTAQAQGPIEVQRPSLVRASAPRLSRQEARRQLGLAEDAFVVLSAGRLTWVKGFDVLAKAATHVRSNRPVRILAVGAGPERGSLRAMGLEVLGARDDLADILVAADVVACPSRSEGFPQVPLEALAAGVPVVAARVGGAPEVVTPDVTGILVPPEDPLALADALSRLAEDRDAARRMGEAGRAWVLREGLTREAMVDRTRRTYDGLLGGDRGAPRE